jgi:hypothetical protein
VAELFDLESLRTGGCLGKNRAMDGQPSLADSVRESFRGLVELELAFGRITLPKTSAWKTALGPREGAIDGQPSAAESVLESLCALVRSTWYLAEALVPRVCPTEE